MTEPTYEELKAQLATIKAKEARGGTLSFKVSDKGLATRPGICLRSGGYWPSENHAVRASRPI